MKKILSLVALSALLFSCSKDNGGGGSGSGEINDFSIQASISGSVGKTSWTSDDLMAGYAIQDNRLASSFTLSSTGEGPSVTFQAEGKVKSGDTYRFIYPKALAGRVVASASFATVPSVQEAVAGSVDDKAFLAYATTDTPSGNVSFQPLLTRIRFTVDKTEDEVIAATLTAGGQPLAGSVRIIDQGGKPLVNSEVSAPEEAINLSGKIEIGKEYSFLAVPGEVEQLVLTLTNDKAGQYRQTFSVAELKGGESLSLGTVTPEFEGTRDWMVYQRATREGIQPLVLVFMSEGFLDASRDTYIKACEDAADFIFSVEPFKHFRDYFSVYIGFEPAKTRGVGSPWNVPLYTDANGNLSFNSMKEAGRRQLYDWIAERCPELKSGATTRNNVGIFMLVDGNGKDIGAVCDWDLTPTNIGQFVALVGYAPDYRFGSQPAGKIPQVYGASYYGYYEGGEDGTVVKLGMEELESLGYKTVYGGTRAYLNDYRGTILHEGMGHGFTHLMDEYWIYTNPYYTYPNGHWFTDLTGSYHPLSIPTGVNLAPSSSDTPWKNLLSLRDELIQKDPRYERIGSFQGGLVQYMFGIWRPERVSVMMDCRPYFSTWQRALAWQRIMRSSGEDPSCDVIHNMDDLRRYLEIDLEIDGLYDPTRDN